MALGPDPTPSRRPNKARPAARARVVATAGSLGALVGITAGIAVNAQWATAETESSQPTAPAPEAPEVEGRDHDDGSWWELGDDHDEDHDDDSWWERAGERVAERVAERLEREDDDDWRAPAPQQVPQTQDGGWSSPAPQQQAPQTRSAGS